MISIITSAFALLVSIGSLGVSACVALRDRARLLATSTFSQWTNRPASIKVEAVNAGRRPVILTKIVGRYEDGDWCATDIGEDKIGIRLQEHERFSEDITDGASLDMLFHPISKATLTDLWLEDTLGHQYRVKKAKKHLKRFFIDWNERNP
jgi:hypothetical protein